MEKGFVIRKAERTQVKIRVALIGPSGSGKTYSALRLAGGLAPGKRAVVIDTENGRSEYYATEFSFDVLRLDPPFSPERYIGAIEAAEQAGAEVIIIDSASHEWNGAGGILRILDNMPGENSFGKWKTLTPRHDAFIDKLIRCRAHLIVGLRGKDEYVLEVNERGKQAPKKVGVGAQMRDGLEYEMTVSFTIDIERHVASVMKDNTHLFDGKFEVLTEAHGAALLAWCESGAAAPERDVTPPPEPAEDDDPRAESRGKVRAQLEEVRALLNADQLAWAEKVLKDGSEKALGLALTKLAAFQPVESAPSPSNGNGNGKSEPKRSAAWEKSMAALTLTSKHPLMADLREQILTEARACEGDMALGMLEIRYAETLKARQAKAKAGDNGKDAPPDDVLADEVAHEQANAELAAEERYSAEEDGARDLFGEPVGAGGDGKGAV